MSDAELVVAQGQENAARKNLSFIERAQFAAELEKQGFERRTIMDALLVDKADVSRFIKIATGLPKDLLLSIGPAPKAGRPRREALIARIQAPGGLRKARAFVKSAMFETLYSDERFSELLERLEPAEQRKAATGQIVVDDGAIGSVKTTRSATTFRLETAAAPGFADFLAEQIEGLYRAWKKTRQND